MLVFRDNTIENLILNKVVIRTHPQKMMHLRPPRQVEPININNSPIEAHQNPNIFNYLSRYKVHKKKP